MNVVQVPRRFVRGAWGGTETVILETSKRLLAAGWATTILCPDALSDVHAEVMDGVPVRRVPYFYPYLGLRPEARRQLDHKGGNMFSFALMRALRRMPALDLVHLHTGNRVGGIGRHVARERRIPYVVSLHGGAHDVPDAERRNLARPTEGTLEWGKVLGMWVGSRRVLQDAAAVICVGEPEARVTRERLPGQRVVYLPNGVDSRRFGSGDGAAFRRRHALAADAEVVLTLGRVDPQKNQILAVDVLAALAMARPRLHLVLVGPTTDEAYHARLVEHVASRGLGGRVTLVPGLSPEDGQLLDAYHAADVFLLPSIHEPFGIVILEAWAAGVPVVASRVGGIPAFVGEGESGLLFASGSVEEAARATRDLLDDRELAARLVERGRALATEAYDWERVTARLIRLYEEVLADHRPVRRAGPAASAS